MRASNLNTFVLVSLSVCLCSTAARARAQSAAPQDELARLRQELLALKREYSARLSAIESQLQALQPAAAVPVPPGAPQPAGVAAPAPSAATAEVPAGAAGAGGPSGPLPVYGGPASSKVFNPDIAVIGDFLGAIGRNPSEGAPPSLEMHEAEASFQAVVDPYARADFFLAASPEGLEIEEGFITFPALPGGVLMKVGKLRGAFGKVNAMHNHVLPWTERPLVTQNLVGGEEGISDAGVSLSRLIPNRLLFLEATGEAHRGGSELFKAPSRSKLAYLGRLRGYGDVTESANLDVGVSLAFGHNGVTRSSTTRLFGVDATFRYRPLRRAIYRRLLARSELVWSRSERESATANAFGLYASGEYQLARRWFAGLRYDRSQRADASLTDKGGSLLLTYWPSEFSQIRAQFRRTRFGEGTSANELLFQFLFSIGAHGAHTF